jgi:hypothetical protein
MGNVRTRIAESLDEMQALDAEISAWHAWWDGSYAISKHRTQLDLLAGLTRGLIDILVSRTSKIDLTGDDGAVYVQCRLADERLHYVRRLWRYYADKFDQRAGPEDDPRTQTLRAADEVIWSCWKTALKNLGAAPEFYAPAPIAYFAAQFSASTNHRADYPPDLDPDLHKLFADHVRELSIPVIALPPGCQRRPWWLVVAAHEIGHHVQWALSGVQKRTSEAIAAAVGGSFAGRWQPWHEELFADACAVLLTGRAVMWAISELETRPAPASGMTWNHRYPPRVVRLAVVRTVAEKAGLLNSVFPERELPAFEPSFPGGDGGGDIAELLGCVPAVADALLGVASDSGAQLRGLASATAPAYAEGVVGYWEQALLGPQTPVPEEDLGAARFCLAGSVAAWQSVASREASDEELADWTAFLAGRVRGVLPGCAEPGTRGGPSGTDTAARAEQLAGQFAADLYAIDPLSYGRIAVGGFAGGAGQQ